jgi:RimJ/RimL family protein N-acetyltransferase
MRAREVPGLVQFLASKNGLIWLALTLRRRFRSRVVSIGVRRDLDVYVPGDPKHDLDAVPPAKIPLEVRLLRSDDDLSFIADDPGIDPRERQMRIDQRWLMQGDLPTPWVAVGPDGTVCFMTFLFTERDNAAIRAKWGDLLPDLKPDEGLVEGPFMAASGRGKGVMKDACRQILVAVRRDYGVRFAMGFIGEANTASLKVAEYGGFEPFMMREESWRLFRRRVRFLPYENAPAH